MRASCGRWLETDLSMECVGLEQFGLFHGSSWALALALMTPDDPFLRVFITWLMMGRTKGAMRPNTNAVRVSAICSMSFSSPGTLEIAELMAFLILSWKTKIGLILRRVSPASKFVPGMTADRFICFCVVFVVCLFLFFFFFLFFF